MSQQFVRVRCLHFSPVRVVLALPGDAVRKGTRVGTVQFVSLYPRPRVNKGCLVYERVLLYVMIPHLEYLVKAFGAFSLPDLLAV